MTTDNVKLSILIALFTEMAINIQIIADKPPNN